MAPVADQPGDPHHPGSQPGPAQVGIHVAATVVGGPDGQPWVQLQIAHGISAFAVNVPADLADQMATAIAAKLRQGAHHARLQASGIILPPAHNGRRPGGPGLVTP